MMNPVEDSKPAAVTAFDVTVNYCDDKHEDVQDASKMSTVLESQLPDQARNDFSPLPWCIDRVGDTQTSNATVPIFASKKELSQNAVLSQAKAPPNQVLGLVTEMAVPWEEALSRDMVLLDSNDMSTLQTEALLAINNNSVTEDELMRVNALKKHPYNYHMKQRLTSGLIWN